MSQQEEIVFLVDDDARVRAAIGELLESLGWRAETFAAAGDYVAYPKPDIPACLILDVELPGPDQAAVLAAVQSEAPNVPVIAVTPRERRAGLLAQLRGDRDDYLLRPFAVDELAARIRLRLRLGPVSGTTMLRHGEVTVDTEFGEVHVDGRRVALSPTEFSVLLALVAEGGSVVPADRLARQAWSEPVSANLVQVYISYLRRKIGPERIRTVRGGGYALEA